MLNSLEGSPVHLRALWSFVGMQNITQENSDLMYKFLDVAYMQGYSDCLSKVQNNLFEQQTKTTNWVDMLGEIK